MTPELVGNAEANLAEVALARGDVAGAERHVAAVAALVADPRNEWMTWRYGMHYRAAAAESRSHAAICSRAGAPGGLPRDCRANRLTPLSRARTPGACRVPARGR